MPTTELKAEQTKVGLRNQNYTSMKAAIVVLLEPPCSFKQDIASMIRLSNLYIVNMVKHTTSK
jgi:hypothetical protein